MKSLRDQYIELLIERAKRRARRWQAFKRFIAALPAILAMTLTAVVLGLAICGGLVFLIKRKDIESRLSRLENNIHVGFYAPTNWTTNTVNFYRDASSPNDTSADQKP